ncbi:MAG: Rib/alpha-like domain-containing protein, partial [Clostridiales bacterium]|nr:Rib/alpha-like domain-containing protein [Clostridiales bacterium]
KTKPATNKAGDAEAVVTVTYPDNTTDEITVPVKVVQPDQPDKERLSKKYPPKAKDEVIQVGETVELDEHNIANWDDISDYVDAVYDETEDKDEILTDRPGRYRNRGKLRILYTDGSEKILKITIKVEGEEETATPSEATPSEATPSEAKGNDAKKYDPIPQDVIVKPGETLEPEEGIKNKEELPSDTEYKDVTPSNVDKTKDYEAIIKVVYPDGSSEEIKVPVTVSKGSRGTGGSWSGGSGGGGSSSRILNTSNDRIYADPDMSVSSGSVGGSWILVDGASNKWSYHTSTGALAKKGWMYISNPYAKDEYGKFSWFKFNEDGIMEYGWIKSQNGKWYHTHAISDGNLGVLHRGWYYEPMDGKWYYLDQKTGAMCEGWLLIDNQYYYFTEAANVLQQTYLQKEDGYWYYDNHNRRPYGSMYQDERTPDNYYVDANGVWKPES